MGSTPPARVIDHATGPDSLGHRIRGYVPEYWLRGVLGGAEAALGSWIVLIIAAIATYVATAADPELGSASWLEAARVGTGLWLLGHGGTIEASEFAITVVPLGVSLLAVLVCSAAIRRARLSTWGAIACAIGTYAVIVALLIQFASMGGMWTALLGAIAVPTAGALLGQRRNYPASEWLARRWRQVPITAQLMLRGALRAMLGMIALGTVATVASVIAGFDLISAMHEHLHTDLVSTAVTGFSDLLVVPTLVVWAIAFLLGPGFQAGAGTVFAPGEIDTGPLPALPILGALPESDAAVATMPILAFTGVLTGLVCGWWLHRQRTNISLGATVATAAGTGLVSGILLAGLSALSAGSVGPGRMAQWGAQPLHVGLAAWWQIGLGMVLVAMLLHPTTRAGFRNVAVWLRLWRSEVRGGQ